MKITNKIRWGYHLMKNSFLMFSYEFGRLTGATYQATLQAVELSKALKSMDEFMGRMRAMKYQGGLWSYLEGV